MGKFWLKSKTIWLNILAGGPLVADAMFGIHAALTEQGGYDLIPEPWAQTLQAVLVIGNIILRFSTTQPVRT